MATLNSSLSLILVLLMFCGDFDLGLTQSGSGCNLSECLMSCPDGQYYNNEIAQNVSDCCELCNINKTDLSSGSGFNCMSCDSLCELCYGPQSTQCYKCRGPRQMVLNLGEEGGGTVCEEDGLVRDTSLDVFECIENCTDGFILNNTTMECVCPSQFYQNGSLCEKCISFCEVCVNGTQAGCLQCGGVQYEGQCLGTCPNNTYNVNGVCLPPSTSRFNLSLSAVIAIIAAIGGAILIFSLLMTIVVCVCLYKWNSKRNQMNLDPNSEGGAVTASESFKKVTRTISLNKYRRTVRPAEGYESMEMHSGNPMFIHDVRQSYDPYSPQYNTTIENVNVQDNNDNEQTNITTSHSTASNQRDEHSDSVYVEMSPGTSIENIEEIARENVIPKTKPYRKVKLSHSFPGLPRSPPPTSPQFATLTQNVHDEEEIEQYVDPNELIKEEYVEFRPEEYIDPSQFIDKPPNYENVVFDNAEGDEEDEQEFYVDISGDFNKPPIPRRAIHPSSNVEPFNPIPIPPRRSRGESLTSPPPDTRRDTLDNQYVVIQKPPRKHLRSTADVLEEHSYVNVSHNSRLRSVTSPEIKPTPPKKGRGNLIQEDSLEEVYI